MRRPISLDLAIGGGTSFELKITSNVFEFIFLGVKTKKLDILGTFLYNFYY